MTVSAPTAPQLGNAQRMYFRELLFRPLVSDLKLRITTASGSLYEVTVLAGGQPRHQPYYDRGHRTTFVTRSGIVVARGETLEGEFGYNLLLNSLYLPSSNPDKFHISSPVVAINLV